MSDWLELSKRYPRDNAMPLRAWRLGTLEAVLDGTMYDCLPHPFSRERTGLDEYVSLGDRRPSVKSNLCRTVVEDSVSLLFSEAHFPAVKTKDARTTAALAALVKDTKLNAVMIDAATRGSVGSIAIQLVVLDFIPQFRVLATANLTPKFNGRGELVQVIERYKVKGEELRAQGYAVPDNDLKTMFWFQRIWNDRAETWCMPQTLADADAGKAPIIDADRTVLHGLGFLPMVWVRNLPGGDDIDGTCTFSIAIDTVMEVDYLLSQAGRALKYGSDPTLVLKSPGGDGPARVGGAASALTVPPEGDAKLLEINGSAAEAVLEHVRYLRTLALESIHGNRSDSDRVTAAQSGRAIELMHAGLIALADRLRISYGEGALLSLLRMVCVMSTKFGAGLMIGGKRVKSLNATDLALHWPPYFPPTPMDILNLGQGIAAAQAGGIVSRETASLLYATAVGLDDPAGEWKRIAAQPVPQPPAAETVNVKEPAA